MKSTPKYVDPLFMGFVDPPFFASFQNGTGLANNFILNHFVHLQTIFCILESWHGMWIYKGKQQKPERRTIMQISNYITKKDAAELRENYIATFGAAAWERLQARARELKELEKSGVAGYGGRSV